MENDGCGRLSGLQSQCAQLVPPGAAFTSTSPSDLTFMKATPAPRRSFRFKGKRRSAPAGSRRS
jgi:hypothetical protein